jgi:hypothetical protein
VPKIISALVKCGDYTTREGMINVCFADEVLRSVVGDPAKLNELKAMGNPDKRFIEGTVRGWFIWWYREGYKAEKFDVGGGEGDEEEEE